MSDLSNNVAKIASLVGDKARASMLLALMEGQALTAGELAIRANISAQTASNHLQKLIKGNLITCEPAGRHRYYKLASKQVAHILESLGILAEPSAKKRPPRHDKLDKDICFARTCYDHLAGKLAVRVVKALIAKSFLLKKENTYTVTKKGKDFFRTLNIDTDALMKKRRQFSKPCLDWTEREHHIAGSLGSAILNYFIKNRLIIRSRHKSRVVILTTKGRAWLSQELDI